MADAKPTVQKIRDIAEQIAAIEPRETNPNSKFVESQINDMAAHLRHVADCIATWDGRHIDEIGRKNSGVLEFNGAKADRAQYAFGFPVTDIIDALLDEMEAEAESSEGKQ
jgi:hypothetical protein